MRSTVSPNASLALLTGPAQKCGRAGYWGCAASINAATCSTVSGTTRFFSILGRLMSIQGVREIKPSRTADLSIDERKEYVLVTVLGASLAVSPATQA